MSDDTAVEYRDKDPEDVWDDGDDVEDKLRVLEKVIDHLRDNRDERFDFRRRDALRLAEKLANQVDADRFNRREKRRLQKIREELEAL